MKNQNISLDRQIVGDIYTSAEAMENLSILCDDFGSRFGGTESEHQAAEFIQQKLSKYGLANVHLEPIEYLGWTRGEARLEIISPIQKPIPCITLPYSPPVELEGKIVDLGDGAPDDFETRAAEIEGNIVMTTSVFNPKTEKRWIHRKEKFGRCLLAGAAGFIFVNHYPGYGPATGGIGHKGQAALIPGISISKEDGAFIQRLAKRKGEVHIRLTSTDQISPAISWNIVGDLPGKQFPDEIVILGSHYDGHDISQGAVDPASGVVAVLEAARTLAKYARSLPRTVRFILWGVEEIGLLGSKCYTEEHVAEMKNIRFYLNLDAAGGVSPKDLMLHEWPDLQATFERYQDEMALDFEIGQSFHTASDHYPLLVKGVPTGGIEAVRKSRTGRGYGTVDKLTITDLRDAAALAARLAFRIAMETDWPVSQRNQEAISELLDQPQQRAVQEFMKRLDALYGRVGKPKHG